MSALRRATAPPKKLVEAVTKSLRPDSLPKISHLFHGSPPAPGRRLEFVWIPAISLSSLISSGFSGLICLVRCPRLIRAAGQERQHVKGNMHFEHAA